MPYTHKASGACISRSTEYWLTHGLPGWRYMLKQSLSWNWHQQQVLSIYESWGTQVLEGLAAERDEYHWDSKCLRYHQLVFQLRSSNDWAWSPSFGTSPGANKVMEWHGAESQYHHNIRRLATCTSWTGTVRVKRKLSVRKQLAKALFLPCLPCEAMAVATWTPSSLPNKAF